MSAPRRNSPVTVRVPDCVPSLPGPLTRETMLLPLTALAAVGAVLVAAVALRTDREPVARVDPDRPGPVLLVAGYGGSTSSLSALADRLRAAGRQVQVVGPVGDNTGDLRAQARELDRLATAAVADGAPSVDVVGYSAGGVVTRVWVAELGGDALVRRVVTLGSPHHGTAVASAAVRFASGGCPEACRQLAEDSDLLSDLPDTPDGPRWVSVWTDGDTVVRPADSARLDGAVNIEVQQVCPDSTVAHGALPRDRVVGSLVLTALSGPGLEEAPPRSACAELAAG